MAFFVVSYDLHNARNYERVWNALTSHGAEKLLESMWLIEYNGTATQLRDSLTNYIDSDDSLALIEIKTGSYWATKRAIQGGVDWLKRNISP